MNKLRVYRGAAGLVDKLDSLRVAYDGDTGVIGLSRADDITYDVTGAFRRRKGFVRVSSAACHSLFSCGHYGLCVSNNILCIINPDFSLTSLNVAITGRKVTYEKTFTGRQDAIYFSDGNITGIVSGLVAGPWTALAYVGVQATRTKVQQYLPEVPAGNKLLIFNGRMYIAKGTMLYCSEVHAFSWFDPLLAYVFDDEITMLRRVYSGIYVGTNKAVIFLQGGGPNDFARVQAAAFGAIEGTDVQISALQIGLENRGDVILFASSEKGLCLADDMGMVTSFTNVTVEFPVANRGSGFIDNNMQYITTIGD